MVIEALLVGNEPVQAVSVRWAATPDQPTPTGGPDPAEVHLWIKSSASDSATVVATDTSGAYTAALSVLPGATYQLSGYVLGAAISGTTTVPSSLQITSPVDGDTLPSRFAGVVEGNPSFALTARLAANVSGGAGFLLEWTLDGLAPASAGSGAEFASTLPPTVSLSFLGSIPIHAHLVVRYLDAHAAAYADPARAQLGLTGAFGVFGSELRDSVSGFVVP